MPEPSHTKVIIVKRESIQCKYSDPITCSSGSVEVEVEVELVRGTSVRS